MTDLSGLAAAGASPLSNFYVSTAILEKHLNSSKHKFHLKLFKAIKIKPELGNQHKFEFWQFEEISFEHPNGR